MAALLALLSLLWLALAAAVLLSPDAGVARAAAVALVHVAGVLVVVLFSRYRWLSRATLRLCRWLSRPGPKCRG